jgi:hypothetical protein
VLVHLAIAVPPGVPTATEFFRRLAECDRIGRHRLTDDPAEADIIVFPDCHVLDRAGRIDAIVNHPLRRRFAAKCVVYDERDRPWYAMPGAYVSMPRWSFDPRVAFATSYVSAALTPQPPANGAPDLLFSFVGSRSHHCREPLLSIAHARAHIEDASGFVFYDSHIPRFEERRTNFVETLGRSKFVLCPRGQGASSIRLYETLGAGRVPVIISDWWVAPNGPRWESFSLRVAEKTNPADLVRLIESKECDYADMSRRAAEAFQQWFGPAAAFSRLVDRYAELLARPQPRFPRKGRRGIRYVVVRSTGVKRAVVSNLSRRLRQRIA